jgi:hypothetical protein
VVAIGDQSTASTAATMAMRRIPCPVPSLPPCRAVDNGCYLPRVPYSTRPPSTRPMRRGGPGGSPCGGRRRQPPCASSPATPRGLEVHERRPRPLVVHDRTHRGGRGRCKRRNGQRAGLSRWSDQRPGCRLNPRGSRLRPRTPACAAAWHASGGSTVVRRDTLRRSRRRRGPAPSRLEFTSHL